MQRLAKTRRWRMALQVQLIERGKKPEESQVIAINQPQLTDTCAS